jgi:hypothetical protein
MGKKQNLECFNPDDLITIYRNKGAGDFQKARKSEGIANK